MSQVRKPLVFIAVALLASSACPWIWGMAQVRPVLLFRATTGGDAALQIIGPLLCSGALVFFATLLILASLVIPDHS